MAIDWEFISKNWDTRKLEALAPEESRQINPSDHPQEIFNYWGLDAIGKDQFTEPESNFVAGSEISSTCVKFDTSHVLYSKLRPYLNKVVVPSVVGIGTTEWVVLRPESSFINRKYLAYVLRTKKFVDYAISNSAGTRMPRTRKDALRESDIPIPYPDDQIRSLNEQRRIVARIEAIFAELRECRSLQKRIVDSTNRVMESAVYHVFANMSSCPYVPLGQVFDFRSELIHPISGRSGALRFVGLQHIEPNTGIRIGEDELKAEDLTGRKFKFSPGQILYGSLRPNLNKVWIADCEGVCSVDQFVLCPKPDEIDTSYLAHYLRSKPFLEVATQQASTLDLPRIRRDRFVLIDVPKPPLHEQRRIAFYLDEMQSQISQMKQNNYPNTVNLDRIEQATLTQAFRGEL